jgi:type IV secretory pathway component VirB8
MSEEREKLNKAFNRSRSRLAYLNIGLAFILALAAVIQICFMLLGY